MENWTQKVSYPWWYALWPSKATPSITRIVSNNSPPSFYNWKKNEENQFQCNYKNILYLYLKTYNFNKNKVLSQMTSSVFLNFKILQFFSRQCKILSNKNTFILLKNQFSLLLVIKMAVFHKLILCRDKS